MVIAMVVRTTGAPSPHQLLRIESDMPFIPVEATVVRQRMGRADTPATRPPTSRGSGSLSTQRWPNHSQMQHTTGSTTLPTTNTTESAWNTSATPRAIIKAMGSIIKSGRTTIPVA